MFGGGWVGGGTNGNATDVRKGKRKVMGCEGEGGGGSPQGFERLPTGT